MRTVRAIHVAASLCVAAAAFHPGAVTGQETVARLGPMEMTSGELQRLLASLTPASRQRLAASRDEMQRVLRNELIGKLLLAEARSKGWDRRPEVAAELERARDRALVAAYVRAVAAPPANYPPEAEIESFYRTNSARFATPAQFHLAQIFIASGNGDRDKAHDALKKVADLSSRLQRANVNFEKLARERSEHRDTAQNGGNVGWMTEQQMPPEIRQEVVRMKKGSISPALATKGGWHFVKLVDVRPGVVRPLAEVRASIVAALRERKAREIEKAQIDERLKALPLTIDRVALDKTVAKTR